MDVEQLQEPIRPANASSGSACAVDLYWLPLGAGGHLVRLNGKAYERLVSLRQRRRPLDLYHSALIIWLPEGHFAIESGPVPDSFGPERGVVSSGPVGSRWAGHLRIFRYEVRCWHGGVIPDLAEAVESPQRLSKDEERARRVLEIVSKAPVPVWGRDHLATGEMWNSNSLVSWLLAAAGLDVLSIKPPSGGRAPGWNAGLVVAARQHSWPTIPVSVSPFGRAGGSI